MAFPQWVPASNRLTQPRISSSTYPAMIGSECLDQPITELETLQTEVAAQAEVCNQQQTWIGWRFTTEDTRVKLKRPYPSIHV